MTDFPDLKFKALVSFPASVLDGVGIDFVNQNGSYQFNIDFSDFAPPVTFGTTGCAANQSALLWNGVTGQYTLVPVGVLAAGGSVPEAPIDGTMYGRKSGTWVDAWASPQLSGDPQAPTAAPGDNDSSIATTAFVTAAVALGGGGTPVAPSNSNPLMDGVAAPGLVVTYARGDHVHPLGHLARPAQLADFYRRPESADRKPRR